MTLGGSSDGRIARHVRNSVGRQRANCHAGAQTGGGIERPRSPCSGTDDDHVKHHAESSLLSDTEAFEDMREDVFGDALSR